MSRSNARCACCAHGSATSRQCTTLQQRMLHICRKQVHGPNLHSTYELNRYQTPRHLFVCYGVFSWRPFSVFPRRPRAQRVWHSIEGLNPEPTPRLRPLATSKQRRCSRPQVRRAPPAIQGGSRHAFVEGLKSAKRRQQPPRNSIRDTAIF